MGGMENTSSQAAVAASPQRMMASSQDFRGAQAGFQNDLFNWACDSTSILLATSAIEAFWNPISVVRSSISIVRLESINDANSSDCWFWIGQLVRGSKSARFIKLDVHFEQFFEPIDESRWIFWKFSYSKLFPMPPWRSFLCPTRMLRYEILEKTTVLQKINHLKNIFEFKAVMTLMRTTAIPNQVAVLIKICSFIGKCLALISINRKNMMTHIYDALN